MGPVADVWECDRGVYVSEASALRALRTSWNRYNVIDPVLREEQLYEVTCGRSIDVRWAAPPAGARWTEGALAIRRRQREL